MDGVLEDSPPVTRALVLAAGQGSRLGRQTSKPLFSLLGVPLLARTLFTLEKAGITDAWVVLGYEGERVQREIDSIRRLNLHVHWIHNPRWKEPNGVSVLAAEEALDGPFILTMSDHLFQAEAVERLMEGVDRSPGLDLVVDHETEDVLDPDDATKVRLRGDRIREIGKELEAYDAIDTGVFLATPALFAALKEVEEVSGRGPSLSEGVKALAEDGRARAVDGSDLPWQDVDTPEDVKAAESLLMSRWPKETDGPVSRFLNRPISTRITRLLVNTPITPNQVSILTLVLGLFSALWAGIGGYAWWLASGVAFQVASILDGTDGELAILTHRTSPQGAWMDTLCDNISYLAFLVGLTVGVYRAGLPSSYLILGGMGLVAAALSMANINAYLIREGRSGSALSVEYRYQKGEGLFDRMLRFMKPFGKRDTLSFLVFVFALVGLLPLGLPLFGVGATLFLLPATTQANLSHLLRTRKLAAARGGED